MLALADLHFVCRRADFGAAAQGQACPGALVRARRGRGRPRDRRRGLRRRLRPGPHRHRRRALGAVDGHSLPARCRRHQPRAGSAHRHRRGRRRPLQLEHRSAHQPVLRLLSRAHRRRLRRLPELRSLPALCFLRNRHRSQVLPHRHLGLHAPRVRRHEARALLLRRLGHGAHRPARGLLDLRLALHRARRSRPRRPARQLPDVVLPAGLRRLRRFSPACGPSTPGRPPATWPRPPRLPCCSPAWS